MSNEDKQEIGRKRIAKLLGVAPFRVELQLNNGGFHIEVDGQPATPDVVRLFQNDIRAKLQEKRSALN